MQQLAREINIPDAEVVEVCIGGAPAELRPHLAMASPASVAALLKLAVVANESLVADANPQFEALNMVTNQLQQFERRMTALHTKANTDANARSQRNSRPFQRRQRNNGPRFQQAWTPPQTPAADRQYLQCQQKQQWPQDAKHVAIAPNLW